MNNVLSTHNYNLSIDSELSDICKIRNGRLWSIMKNGNLLYADLNNKPKPFIKVFSDVKECEAIFVSPGGEFCLIRTKTEHYHIFIKDLIPYLSPVPPGTLIRCATFFYVDKEPKPYIFMGTNLGQVTYFNLNRMIISLPHLPILIQPASPVDGVSVVRYQNGFFGLSVITGSKIIPFILQGNFSESNLTKPRIPQIPPTSPERIFCGKNLIGILTDQLAFEFIVQSNTTKPRLDQQLTHQIFYTISEEPENFCMFDEFMLLFTKSKKVKIYMNGFESEIETFTVSNASTCEYDVETGELYSICGKKVFQVVPNFIEKARTVIAKKFISSGKFEEAASIVSEMKNMGICEMLHFVGTGNEIRFSLLMKLLEKCRANGSPFNQKVSLAYIAFDYYVRVESERENPNIEKFVKFTKSLLSEKLIMGRDIIKVLSDYGWYEPVIYVCEPLAAFDFYMKIGDIEKSLRCLSKIDSGQNGFYESLLRIFPGHINEVLSIVSRLSSYDCSKLIPILMRKESRQFVLSMLDSEKLTSVWLSRIFCIFLSRAADLYPNLVTKFFIQNKFSDDHEIQFLSRSMLSAGQYKMLANGLKEIGDYLGATMAASKGNSAYAFTLISTIKNPRIQKKCSRRILRSMNITESAFVANYLLENYEKSGVEADLLMEYLPNNIIGAKLANFVENIGEKYSSDSSELNKNINEALEGCESAENLIRNCHPKAVKLPSLSTCSKCKKSIFTGSGIVYPCSHMLHYNCALQLASQFKDEKIDFVADCPICGFLSVRLIDQPFLHPSQNADNDPWSVDQAKLEAIGAIHKKKAVNILLEKFEKDAILPVSFSKKKSQPT